MLTITKEELNKNGDRNKFVKGEWDKELDIYELSTEDGWKAYIKHHPRIGHLCGYLAIPEDHPFYREHYDINVRIHGGLTYASEYEGEFQIGFDCAHWNDTSPFQFHSLPFPNPEATYKNVEFVCGELEKLIKQCQSLVPA